MDKIKKRIVRCPYPTTWNVRRGTWPLVGFTLKHFVNNNKKMLFVVHIMSPKSLTNFYAKILFDRHFLLYFIIPFPSFFLLFQKNKNKQQSREW